VSGSALNLGFTDWDSGERVSKNRAKFFSALGADTMRVVTLRQIHGDIVYRVDASMIASMRAPVIPREEAPQADALITQERGVLLAVQTADCVPMLLADAKNRAVAAIHSGWRGTLRRIAEKTLGRMQMEFDRGNRAGNQRLLLRSWLGSGEGVRVAVPAGAGVV
jgi:YfiH family protein